MMTIAATCLDQATEAYMRHRDGDRQQQIDDCTELAEWGVLSNRALEEITGLPEGVVRALSQKTDHRGGRLVPSTLPLILAVRDDYRRGYLNGWLLKQIARHGTSLGMVARLTEIPIKDVRRAGER
jgi:hypothetical protein